MAYSQLVTLCLALYSMPEQSWRSSHLCIGVRKPNPERTEDTSSFVHRARDSTREVSPVPCGLLHAPCLDQDAGSASVLTLLPWTPPAASRGSEFWVPGYDTGCLLAFSLGRSSGPYGAVPRSSALSSDNKNLLLFQRLCQSALVVLEVYLQPHVEEG